jgi:hypothetical protein
MTLMQSKLELLWNDLRPVNKEHWPEANFDLDMNEYRFDDFGAIIKKSEYGKMTSFGWTIDHIFPLSKGSSDNIVNLRLLHWENNQAKGDDFPLVNWTTSRKIDGKTLENESYKRMRVTYPQEILSQLSNIYPRVYQYC